MQVDRWRSDIVPHPPELAQKYAEAGAWPNRTVAEQFHDVAVRHPDLPAVIATGRTMTYRELDEATDRIAAGLAGLGLERGEAVLFQVENKPETIVAWYAVIKAGLIPVATLAAHRAHELQEIGELTEAGAHLIAADYTKFDLLGLARRLRDESGRDRKILTLGSTEEIDGATRLEDLGSSLSPAEARAIVEKVQEGIDGDDVAVFQLSGGTSATPKVIPRLHDDYWYNGLAYARRLDWDSSTRLAHILPIVHNAGIVTGTHAVHSVGGAVVLATAQPDHMFPLFAESGVTDLMSFPALAYGWRDHPLFDAAFASVKRIVLTGGVVTDASFELFESRGIKVLGMYGAGEGLISVTDPDEDPAVRQRSVGTPVSELDDVRVLQFGSEEPTPVGEVGELCYAGPYTLRGYFRAPERNAERFTSDGLYRSGDVVRMVPIAGKLCLTFEGRGNDNINRGGEKINAAEIEALVLDYPGIRRAALIPIPDNRLGERACLCIEVDPDVAAPELSEITRYLEKREVAKFKWPERLEVFDQLPRTNIDKISKRALIDEVTAHLKDTVGAAAAN